MSVPCGSAAPFPILDRRVRDELMAHRAKVLAALSRHSDPALREIGRLLAAGAASPQQLRKGPLHADQLRRIARKLKEMDPETRGPGANPNGSAAQPSAPDEPPSGSGTQPIPVGAPSFRPETRLMRPGPRSNGSGAQRHGARSYGTSTQFEEADAPLGAPHDPAEADRAHEAGPARGPATPSLTMVREVCQPSGGEPTRPAG